MKIAKTQKITDNTASQILDEVINRLYRAVNKRLSFDDNLEVDIHNVTISQNNGKITIRHNLGRTPAGFIQADSTGQGILYRIDPWTANEKQVEVYATVSGSYKIILY